MTQESTLRPFAVSYSRPTPEDPRGRQRGVVPVLATDRSDAETLFRQEIDCGDITVDAVEEYPPMRVLTPFAVGLIPIHRA